VIERMAQRCVEMMGAMGSHMAGMMGEGMTGGMWMLLAWVALPLTIVAVIVVATALALRVLWRRTS
jgi:hypothetical protein